MLTRQTAFTPFSPTPTPSPTALPLQKLTYVLCNLLTLAVGLWKCRSMGLFPSGTGDWLAFETHGMVRFHLHHASFNRYSVRVRRDALFFFLEALLFLGAARSCVFRCCILVSGDIALVNRMIQPQSICAS